LAGREAAATAYGAEEISSILFYFCLFSFFFFVTRGLAGREAAATAYGTEEILPNQTHKLPQHSKQDCSKKVCQMKNKKVKYFHVIVTKS
jgi:hypothetical protein